MTIKDKNLFAKIIRFGKSINTPFGQIKYLSSTHSEPRIGIVLGVKSGLKPVKRNRIRRILKEAWRLMRNNISPRVDIVVFPKSDIFVLKSTKIRDELEKIFLGNKI